VDSEFRHNLTMKLVIRPTGLSSYMRINSYNYYKNFVTAYNSPVCLIAFVKLLLLRIYYPVFYPNCL